MTNPAVIPSERIVMAAGECRLAEGLKTQLITYNLGACIAVAVHVRSRQLGGLLRFSFADSRRNAEAARNSWLFGDLALPRFFEQLQAAGIKNSDMSVRIVGGAFIGTDRDSFPVAKDNRLAIRSFLWRAGIVPDGEDLGGSLPRSLWFDSHSGRLIVRTGVPAATGGNGILRDVPTCHLAS